MQKPTDFYHYIYNRNDCEWGQFIDLEDNIIKSNLKYRPIIKKLEYILPHNTENYTANNYTANNYTANNYTTNNYITNNYTINNYITNNYTINNNKKERVMKTYNKYIKKVKDYQDNYFKINLDNDEENHILKKYKDREQERDYNEEQDYNEERDQHYNKPETEYIMNQNSILYILIIYIHNVISYFCRENFTKFK